jgi:hypothetical protein
MKGKEKEKPPRECPQEPGHHAKCALTWPLISHSNTACCYCICNPISQWGNWGARGKWQSQAWSLAVHLQSSCCFLHVTQGLRNLLLLGGMDSAEDSGNWQCLLQFPSLTCSLGLLQLCMTRGTLRGEELSKITLNFRPIQFWNIICDVRLLDEISKWLILFSVHFRGKWMLSLTFDTDHPVACCHIIIQLWHKGRGKRPWLKWCYWVRNSTLWVSGDNGVGGTRWSLTKAALSDESRGGGRAMRSVCFVSMAIHYAIHSAY